MKATLSIFALMILFLAAAQAESLDVKGALGFTNAIEIEAGGFEYGQFVLYYERLLMPHLSVNIGMGYSPVAQYGLFYGSTYSYALGILELRGYPMSDYLKGLYVGGCVGMYFANTLLDWSQWGMGSTEKGSVAIATQVSAGWKFVIPVSKKLSFTVDPEIYYYTVVPTSISMVSTSKSETFVFHPTFAFANIYVGLEF